MTQRLNYIIAIKSLHHHTLHIVNKIQFGFKTCHLFLIYEVEREIVALKNKKNSPTVNRLFFEFHVPVRLGIRDESPTMFDFSKISVIQNSYPVELP